MDLPAVIPLFPLPNAVLFPGAPLPLHVFEPRYRDMVRDAARGADRVVGMVLLRGEWRQHYYGRPEIFPVGCAGRLVNVQPLADGCYNILLQGLREFSIDGELSDRTYRQAIVTWRSATGAGLGPELRGRIQGLMRRFAGRRQPRLVSKLLQDASVSDELLVNLLCYALEFSALEKQALLAAPTLLDRGARLCEVVQFALESGVAGPDDDERCH